MAPPAAPPKKRHPVRLIVSLVVVLVVVVLAIIGVVSSRKDAVNAKVGDCINPGAVAKVGTTSDASGAKIVACTDGTAKYKVIGKVDNKTESEFSTDDKVCGAFQAATASFWWGKSGQSGSVLCLADNK